MTIKTEGKLSLSQKPELPIDGLPASIQEYINAVCEIYHCPREFVTASVLATAATAVGKRIKINEGKYKNNLVLWFVLVARSGSNKSYPMKLVSSPLRKIDAELFEIYKLLHNVWKTTPAKERDENEPRCPAIVLDDCTDERRNEILFLNDSANQPDASLYVGDPTMRGAIGIYPELKGMFDSKNQYQNGGTAPISRMLRLFDCECIKVDRRNSATMLIRNPFLNIIGDLQTGMLRATFGNELFMTNGLNQRFLFCVVEDIDYPNRSHKKLPPQISAHWDRTIRMLYENVYHTESGGHITLFRATDGEVNLTEGADRLYEAYYNQLQERKRNAANDYEASIYSKLQIQVLRFAGVVHALELVEEKGERRDYNYLHEDTMEYAIRCMAYFEAMAKIVYLKITETPMVKRSKDMTQGELLHEFMQRFRDISLNKLAELLGVSRQYLSKIKSSREVDVDKSPNS